MPAVRLRDALLAALLLVTAQATVWTGAPGPWRAAEAVVVAAFCLPLAVRRGRPVLAFAVVALAALAQPKVSAGTWSVPTDEGLLQAWVALLVATFGLGAHGAPRAALATGGPVAVALVGNDLALVLAGITTLDHTVPAWFILAAACGLGFALRGREARVAELAGDNARLERERLEAERAAAEAERTRIARELHDIVAHSISVMVVQAQAGERTLEGAEPSAREALVSIQATGRQALDDMRRLVGMLREDEHRERAPQPGLGELDTLLGQVRAAGLEVDVEVQGRPRELAPGIDLAAFRIVQEALTNVLAHAGPATARLRLAFGDAHLVVEVLDDGQGPRPRTGPGGNGLAGMRERVAVFGGALDAGPAEGRGFVVRARLPA